MGRIHDSLAHAVTGGTGVVAGARLCGEHAVEDQRGEPRPRRQENLVVLAFSGGGTRAAAFSYGVLEFFKRTEIVMPNGAKFRLLDSIDVITGVSGGSFTALAYGLYGDKLFDDYEQRFLKRNVQGDLVSRALVIPT